VRYLLHLNAFKTLYVKEKPPDQEYYDGYGHQQGKNIAGCHNNIVQDTQYFQRSFNAKKAIDHHFDTAENDHAETPEYQRMKKAHDRMAEYLGLSDGYFEHHHGAFTKIPDGETGFGKPEKTDEPQDGVSKYPERNQKC